MGFNGHMQVMTFAQGNETGLQIQVSHSAEVAEPARRLRQGVGLDLCEKLIWEMGGVLTVTSADAENWQARLAWPTAVSPLLLVIDDNAGLADLFQRFLAGTDWQVLRAAGGSEARAVIAAHRPGVITLDVMMPGEDGWELLMASNRQNRPATSPSSFVPSSTSLNWRRRWGQQPTYRNR
jgi:hypothetical protein